MSRREKFRFYEVLPVQFLLYLVLRTLIMIIDMFPYRMAPVIAAFLGASSGPSTGSTCGSPRRTWRSRTGLPSGPESRVHPEGLRKRGPGFIEMLMLPRLMKRHEVSRYVKLVRYDVFDRLKKEGRGSSS